MSKPQQIAKLAAIVASIYAATEPGQLDDIARDLMGLESVDADEAGPVTMEEARAILLDWVREECFDADIHTTAVGIRQDALIRYDADADVWAAYEPDGAWIGCWETREAAQFTLGQA